MAPIEPVALSEEETSFHDYLLLRRKDRTGKLTDDEEGVFEEYARFLANAYAFFTLRAEAENHYRHNRHIAKSRHGALPLTWSQIKEVLGADSPPETLISQIAKRHLPLLDDLLKSPRKILKRVQCPVPISQVQQLDAHCLRWLTRQPGRTAIEKAGQRQRLQAIVRKETYNTLENRVLKDFLSRAITAANLYLAHNRKKFSDHETYLQVSRFRNLCLRGLAEDEFAQVAPLATLPVPNYVLQQDRRYSVIWNNYLQLVRQDDVAERLWERHAEIDGFINTIQAECTDQITDLNRLAPLWFNELDGKSPPLENPYFEKTAESRSFSYPEKIEDGILAVNFTSPHNGVERLHYPANHPNAKPYFGNRREPDDSTIQLEEIIEGKEEEKLSDYFEQLQGLVNAQQWYVLVKDYWYPDWLEKIIRAVPLPRSQVFLLWRSIAMALGILDSQLISQYRTSLAIIDDYPELGEGSYVLTELKLYKDHATSRLLPSRASYRLKKKSSFAEGTARELQSSIRGCPQPFYAGKYSNSIFADHLGPSLDLITYGVRRFHRERAQGLVSYYDELEALSLIVQRPNETVESTCLVEHNERSPGGAAVKKKNIPGGMLAAGEEKLDIFLYEGIPSPMDEHKKYTQIFEKKIKVDASLFFATEMTPGQGLALVTICSDALPNPVTLNLEELQQSKTTLASKMKEMHRSFPPIMPLVTADSGLWQPCEPAINRYINRGILPNNNGIFAKACLLYPSNAALPASAHPLDRLKRKNVFGNDAGSRVPKGAGNNLSFPDFFDKLACDYARSKGDPARRNALLHLIAWTYQYDNPCFNSIRKELHDKYCNQQLGMSRIEVTFCSNCMDKNHHLIRDIFKMALIRMKTNTIRYDEYRLVYNLLQFYPEITQSSAIPTGLYEDAMRHCIATYNQGNGSNFVTEVGRRRYWNGAHATQTAGALLRCMLFLLHRRRFDRDFFKQSGKWTPEGFLGEELTQWTTTNNSISTLAVYEQTRKCFIDYANGNGTIEGLPVLGN